VTKISVLTNKVEELQEKIQMISTQMITRTEELAESEKVDIDDLGGFDINTASYNQIDAQRRAVSMKDV